MTYIVNTIMTSEESKMVADIIVSFSLVDEALCIFLEECPLEDDNLSKAIEKIKKDRSNIGMGDKIKLVVKFFPNDSVPCFSNLKGNLMKMKKIRNQVAHNSRFFFGSNQYLAVPLFRKKYSKGEEPIGVLYKQYSRCFSDISEFLQIIYSDWEYKNTFLYGV